MRLFRRRIKQLLARVEQALAAQHAATRCGARIVAGDTYQEFREGCERIMATEPGSYLFVPEQESLESLVLRTTGKSVEQHEAEWLAKRAEHTQDNE